MLRRFRHRSYTSKPQIYAVRGAATSGTLRPCPRLLKSPDPQRYLSAAIAVVAYTQVSVGRADCERSDRETYQHAH